MGEIKIEQSLLSAVNLNVLYVHVAWCFWHEGANLYDGSFPGAIRDVNALRDELEKLQSHNDQVHPIIVNASNDELRYIFSLIEPRAENEHQISANFIWVASHEKQRDTFRDLLAIGNYADIRKVFHDYQSHDVNIKNTLSCVSNFYIKRLIDAI